MADTWNGDGGPAFPIATDGSEDVAEFGMSLRDYFAAKQMQAYRVATLTDKLARHSLTLEAERRDVPYIDAMATLAYEDADALLRAREKAQS